MEWLQGMLWRRRAARVEVLAGGRGRVLDLGCGPGWVLGRFRDRGWEVQGTEVSEAAARHAREVLRLPVAVAPETALPWPDRYFDAVILWHVLEHLAEPEATLREAARVLRPGGVLLVGVPNFGSPEARLAADQWFHLDVPRHRVHFTRPVLRRALASAGLVVRRVSFFAPEYDVFSFVQSALNRLGFRPNLLYNRLRGAQARVLAEEAGKGRRAQEILSLVLAIPLGVLSVVWTALAGLTGQGATLTLWAVREG
jgi:SAM-dependent methyltransferase